MQIKSVLKLSPEEVLSDQLVKQRIAEEAGIDVQKITGFRILKKSMDARSRQIWFNLTVLVFVEEPFALRNKESLALKDVSQANRSVIVVGAGPAGLYAALELISYGIRPIVLERGKNVRDRRRDLAQLNKDGIVNPESNYCFGEGGAGTYSDGKLYTRSNKRGSIDKALNIFYQYGAEENVLYEAHPHIGTNKLPHIITAMREAIVEAGGEFLFESKVIDFVIQNDEIQEVVIDNGNKIPVEALILATGHSARDIFELLYRKNILIEAKPFALGVRVEHPQELINEIQYCRHKSNPGNLEILPPASYSLVQQVDGKGVFSFCMCPGGIIAPAATSPGELVVNGWSPSKRNNPYANSGMVVQTEIQDAIDFFRLNKSFDRQNDWEHHPLLLMYFQEEIEKACFVAGGGKMVAPAQRLNDFVKSKMSSDLPICSYIPGTQSTDLQNVLPFYASNGLKEGFKAFNKSMPGYLTNEAIIVATESRTSSPVRIPRDRESLRHPQIKNLYPCGEGAGYAGGIISAAMDGMAVAQKIAEHWQL
ncbi:MAG: FAD-binding protein [Pseudopedobacter saltans]|uniref:FAD-binding protein n=1 Tax=Pseudopedobacter saltans TaxID=151895 RepID=A0A2W5F6Z7_9SPHI|nr:MAG: FAD-binding protein [Pseudopedobacter saltans]